MDKVIYALGIFVAFVALVLVFGLITAWPTMILWNWLMPSIFKLREINFWEAWGLLALFGLLFKSTNSSSSNSK